jgi:hypothetical protein
MGQKICSKVEIFSVSSAWSGDIMLPCNFDTILWQSMGHLDAGFLTDGEKTRSPWKQGIANDREYADRLNAVLGEALCC